MSRTSQPMNKLAPLTTTTSTVTPPPQLPPQMASFVPANYVQPRSQSIELLPEIPASNAASCSNCKIPEPKKPIVPPTTVKAQPQIYQTFNEKTVTSPTPAINKIEKVYSLMNAITSPKKPIINSFANNINNNNKITSNQVTNNQIQSDAPALTVQAPLVQTPLVQAPLVQLNNDQIQNDSPVNKPNNDFRLAPVQRQPESSVLRQLTPAKPKQTTIYSNNNDIKPVEPLARSNFNNDIPAISTYSEGTKQQVLKKNDYQTQQPSPKTQTVDRGTNNNFNAANIKAMEQLLTGLLYQFNYTVGYHGHHETGDRAGNKEGGYFVVGRDGYKRTVDYKANEFGYQPIIKLENVGPEATPHEDTEKEAGLKGYEFNWFYV